MATATANTQDITKKTLKRRLEDFWRYVRRNPSLGVGIALFLTLFLFVAIGYATYEVERYRPLSGGPDLAPFEKDPYGCLDPKLSNKRFQRDPFAQYMAYPTGCPELGGLFNYCSSTIYQGPLPWDNLPTPFQWHSSTS